MDVFDDGVDELETGIVEFVLLLFFGVVVLAIVVALTIGEVEEVELVLFGLVVMDVEVFIFWVVVWVVGVVGVGVVLAIVGLIFVVLLLLLLLLLSDFLSNIVYYDRLNRISDTELAMLLPFPILLLVPLTFLT